MCTEAQRWVYFDRTLHGQPSASTLAIVPSLAHPAREIMLESSLVYAEYRPYHPGPLGSLILSVPEMQT